jgi:hypothetical protein
VTAAKQTPTSTDFAATVLNATEESIKQAQDLFVSAFGQARQFADTLADATMATAKRNQLVTDQAIGSLANLLFKGFDGSLSSLPRFDARESVAAGFELAQTFIDTQRELAERLVGTVARPAAAA